MNPFSKALLLSAFFFCTGHYLWADTADPFESTVKWVVDGDTVVLDNDEKLRLIGINAPEKASDDRLAEPYALEAKLLLAELVLDQTITIHPGTEGRDRYGRMLGSITLSSGRNVQSELLKKGYAAQVVFPPDLKYLDLYARSEEIARNNKIGIWGLEDRVKDISQSKLKLPNGFNFVKGKVSKIKNTKKYKKLILRHNFDVLIKHEHWDKYWKDSSKSQLANKIVEVRGWISGRNNSQRMIIRHPYELTIEK